METALDPSRVELLKPTDWLNMHYDREHMSASRVAGALGYSEFEGNSPLGNYAELRGEIPPPDTNLPMMLGHLLEPAVDTLYRNATGRRTVDLGEYAIVRHPDMPWLFCTLDRVTWNKSEQPGALELKTTGSYNKEDWDKGEGPVEHQIQNMIQMMCTGFGWGSLAVLVGNREFFTHDFLRDDELAEALLRGIDSFRDRVLKGDPPDPTWQDGEIIKKLHPLDNGKTIPINTDEMANLLFDFEDSKAQLKVTGKLCDEQKFKIAAAMGENTFLECQGLRYSYKHQARVTKAAVMPEHEHLLDEAGIEYKPSKTSDFRVMRKAK